MPNHKKIIQRAVILSLFPISVCFSIAHAGIMIPQGNGAAMSSLTQPSPSAAATASNASTPALNQKLPHETAKQKAAILEDEKIAAINKEKAENEASAENAKEAELQKQESESINGLGGPYFLPPLPTPSSVRPMVGTQLHEEFPLSTHEIQWVKQQMQQDQYAIHKGAPLKILNPSIRVSTGPGSTVPTIRIAPGYVTSVSIVGVDGNPWPISSRQVGGGTSFKVSAVSQDADAPSPLDTKETNLGNPAKNGKKTTAKNYQPVPVLLPNNLLTISPKYFGSSSNLMLTLKGSNTPLMINVISDGPSSKTVDGMVTLRLNRHGPDAPPALFQAPPPSAIDSDLLLFLSQTPPKSAKFMHASGGMGIKAWEWDGKVIIRTTLPLRSPAWTAEVRQNGVTVYDLPLTHVLLMQDNMNSVDGSSDTKTVLLSNESEKKGIQ